MCIAILNNGKKLTRKELSNCWTSNDDGAGMLYVQDGHLEVFKQPNHDGYSRAGACFDKFYKEYERIYSMSNRQLTPILVHFRIATHGLDPMYLHPFLVSENVGLIHNGIIHGYGTRDISDTAEFTLELSTLPRTMTQDVEFLDNPFVKNSILDKLESSNKVVFMDSNGEYRIFNAQLGHWVGQNWFSNDAYKTRKTYYGSFAATKATTGAGFSYGAKNQDYYDDLEDDWYGWGKKSTAAVAPVYSSPFIEDKTYHCEYCKVETLVDDNACCVVCTSYVEESETDVVEKMLRDEQSSSNDKMILMH